jgi:signal transduction histidine kinase
MLGLHPADGSELEMVAQQDRSSAFFHSAIWLQTAAPVLVLGLLALAVGSNVRNRRLHIAALVDAANALARDQDQRARLVQAAERARIAREMHDVVAHSVSVMVALGGGASMALDWAPERSRAALDELVATGRSALADMRRVLGVLDDTSTTDTGAAPAWGDTPLAPQPGSLDLGALVDRTRAAGLPVHTTGLADTGLQDLDVSLQLAVYRIVQESLTNVLRHAPGTPAVEVDVLRRPDSVEVVVTDHGAAVAVEPSPGSRRGLVGMRERAAVFGGSVDAGPYGQGWRIRALLPWHEGDR